MENGVELPARTVNVLLNIVMSREICLAAIKLRAHTEGLSNGFRPREFMSGLGASGLERKLNESNEIRGRLLTRIISQ